MCGMVLVGGVCVGSRGEREVSRDRDLQVRRAKAAFMSSSACSNSVVDMVVA